jgi:hypothetical protein
MACAKHYALNSMENARFQVDVSIDEGALHEVYLPHFKRAADEGIAGIMMDTIVTGVSPARPSPEDTRERILRVRSETVQAAATSARTPGVGVRTTGSGWQKTGTIGGGATSRPPGSSAPASSNSTTPLQSRLHPCSG